MTRADSSISFSLQAFFSGAPFGYGLLDRELRYLELNEFLARMNGKSIEEHLGRSVDEILPEAVEVMVPMLRKLIETAEPTLNWKIRVPIGVDKQLRDLLVSYYPLFGPLNEVIGVGGVVLDITDAERAEERARQTSEVLAGLMQGSADALFVKDLESRYLLVNPACAQTLGASEAEILGKDDYEFFSTETARKMIDRDREIMGRGETRRFEDVDILRGQRRVFQTSKSPYRDALGQVVGLVGVARDITTQKNQEEEKLALIRDLERANAQLRDERELRDRMVTGLSHDLRTPLTVARVAAQIIERAPQDAEMTVKLAQRIARAIDRSDRMIRDLLDASRVREGHRLQLTRAPLNLGILLSSVVEELRGVHGDRFRLEVAPGIPTSGTWDGDAIQRAVENLCVNAVRYGSGTEPVEVLLEGTEFEVVVSVRNRGNPIPDEAKARLFDKFERFPSGSGEVSRGWGLGLTVVHGVVAAHGGRVEVESSEARGTVFRLTLPRADATGD